MIKTAIKKVLDNQNLTKEEAELTMNFIMDGNATPSQISALLIALRCKGESIEEITGFASSMREHATKIFPKEKNLVDTCGTGGDVSGSFNISTVAAFVAAGAGVRVAKHGNRSVSSKCGSADLLEALGVKIDIPPQKVEECINEVGIGFIYAPKFHGAMKHAMPTRREIGIRTVFNILGPITNPAGAKHQILGVFSEKLTETMANVLKNLGATEAMIVHGMDGLDEISISDKTKVSHLKNGKIKNYFIKPEDLKLKKYPHQEILGGSVEENKNIATQILNGTEKGAKRAITLINAAAAILVSGLAKDLKQAKDLAERAIDTGDALEKLNKMIGFTNG
ncbi:MAG: anthranilate phosphoribosyltransferase [Candidatus Margulisbacteria bacterium]|nr:anthranilate phosphoribosyltransferase [Candidatus Margulisiibacteriota bacterium]MBU1021333.1 anthranilate phosphoribosyltransferase [Candidatus Margulisiibacteriota bacterium]MBU1729178.1 anthranilate phosphoribosyltransferase [Candidatus Margulisiibacteriota bacterium]MBU1954851.1 anthranilate phosphoribosyltransferase [Candidatus Margulisiibacteriota bacterium]